MNWHVFTKNSSRHTQKPAAAPVSSKNCIYNLRPRILSSKRLLFEYQTQYAETHIRAAFLCCIAGYCAREQNSSTNPRYPNGSNKIERITCCALSCLLILFSSRLRLLNSILHSPLLVRCLVSVPFPPK